MDTLTAFCSPLFLGLAIFALQRLRAELTARWKSGKTTLTKPLKWAVTALTVALVFWAAGLLGSPLSLATVALCVVLGYALPNLYLYKRQKDAAGPRISGGILSADKVRRQVLRSRKVASLQLGGVPVPFDSEPGHILFAGDDRVGVQAGFASLLSQARQRGDTLIVVDANGELLSKYYDEESDFVFNPYDERCVGWSPIVEYSKGAKALDLAKAIVPDSSGEARAWHEQAQAFLAALLKQLTETEQLSLKDFVYYVQKATLEELRTLFSRTTAARLLDDEGAFGVARALAAKHVKPFELLPAKRQPFSVAEMVQAEHSGVLFVTYQPDHLDSLSGLMASLLDVVLRTAASLPADTNRRIWVLADKLPLLGKIPALEEFMATASGSGGCLAIGVPALPELVARYDEPTATKLLTHAGTWVVHHCTDTTTASFVSNTLQGKPAADVQSAGLTVVKSKSKGDTQESLLPKVQALDDGKGILRLPGFPLCSVQLTAPESTRATEAFQRRSFMKEPPLKVQRAEPAPPVEAPAPVMVAPHTPTAAPVHHYLPDEEDLVEPENIAAMHLDLLRNSQKSSADYFLSEPLVPTATPFEALVPNAFVLEQDVTLLEDEAVPLERPTAIAEPEPAITENTAESVGTSEPVRVGGPLPVKPEEAAAPAKAQPVERSQDAARRPEPAPEPIERVKPNRAAQLEGDVLAAPARASEPKSDTKPAGPRRETKANAKPDAANRPPRTNENRKDAGAPSRQKERRPSPAPASGEEGGSKKPRNRDLLDLLR